MSCFPAYETYKTIVGCVNPFQMTAKTPFRAAPASNSASCEMKTLTAKPFPQTASFRIY